LALKKVYFGSVGPFVYDDTVPVNDPDGDFAGEDHRSMTTDGQLFVEQGPVLDEEVIRLVDLGFRLLPPVSVVDIDNPTELNTLTGDLGALVLTYEIIGATGQNEYTIYAYDASGPAVNAPYIMDADGAGDERWIAIAGKYTALNFYLNQLSVSEVVVTDANKMLSSLAGSNTDFTVITSTRAGGGGGVGFQYKTRALTLEKGLITVVGAEGAWIDV
jgi:hypothetical protein